MKKTFEFKGITDKSITTGLIIGAIYLTTVFMIFYFLCGGIFEMANMLDGVGGSSKVKGILVGFLVLIPFFIILQFIHPKFLIEIDTEKIVIQVKNKPDEIIYLSSIGRMEHNAKKVNKLDIYDVKGQLINYINPSNNRVVLGQIIDEITTNKKFDKNTKTENHFGTPLERSVYKAI